MAASDFNTNILRLFKLPHLIQMFSCILNTCLIWEMGLYLKYYYSVPNILSDSHLFAFALAKKALQLPTFSNFFSPVLLDRLTKFFSITILDLLFCSACNQDWSDSPGQTDLKPEKKFLLPFFGEWNQSRWKSINQSNIYFPEEQTQKLRF